MSRTEATSDATLSRNVTTFHSAGVIGVDRLMGLPLAAQDFYQVQVNVDYLSGMIYAEHCRSTDTAAGGAKQIFDMALRSSDGIPDVLVGDQDPKLTSTLFREFTWRIGSSLIV